MCIIIAKPANAVLPYNHMVESVENNYDGWGLAYADNEGHLKFLSGWDAQDLKITASAPLDRPWLFHARFATHGAAPGLAGTPPSLEAERNRQPFIHSEQGWAMAHNGILSHYTPFVHSNGASDSRLLATDVAEELAADVALFRASGKLAKRARRKLRMLVGNENERSYNKIAFLYAVGNKPFHLEGKGWHTKDGIWYSNYSYEPSHYSRWTSSYGGWSSDARFPNDEDNPYQGSNLTTAHGSALDFLTTLKDQTTYATPSTCNPKQRQNSFCRCSLREQESTRR